MEKADDLNTQLKAKERELDSVQISKQNLEEFLNKKINDLNETIESLSTEKKGLSAKID